jgi:hypothetical protein
MGVTWRIGELIDNRAKFLERRLANDQTCFVGIDLGDKNSVARVAIDKEAVNDSDLPTK